MVNHVLNTTTRTVAVLVVSFTVSCASGSRLKQALELAGDNRRELEKVLEHYRETPLQLKAAKFLIENMPSHYSYLNAKHILFYYNEIDSLSSKFKGMSREDMDKAYHGISQKYSQRLQYISDIEIMGSDYLISNIDNAFADWREREWAAHISFNEFCEYLLPYKVTEFQELDDWRSYMKDRHKGELDKLSLYGFAKNVTLNACFEVSENMREELQPLISFDNISMPVRRMLSLSKKHIGTCEDYSVLALGVMRSKGIPVAIDFVHQWPFRSLGHSWNVLLNNTGKNIVFDASSSGPGQTSLDFPLGKVYRRTYAINKEIEKIHTVDKAIPPTFMNVCIKDVSDEYMVTDNIKIQVIDVPKTSHYAYLSVFDNKEWIPVHYGKIAGGKVRFEKMGRGVVYLPVCWSEKGMVPVGVPFILTTTGEIKTLTADNSQIQTVKISRKYPVANKDVVWAAERAQYGRIQASDHEDFRDSLTVYTIKNIPIVAGEILLDTLQRPYRYWRYLGNWHTNCNIAELNFYPIGGNKCNVGRIIGTSGSYNDSPDHTKEAAFDGNSLTFFDAPTNSGSWVGIDFGEHMRMQRINYTPRSDGNCVDIGHEYELVYWDKGKWNSLGRRTADNVYLNYEVPMHALFLLHNHTTGVQERIFTYEKNKQVWW